MTDVSRGNFPVLNIHEYVRKKKKNTDEASMTLNVPTWKGVLMPRCNSQLEHCVEAELIEGNGYEGRQTSKGELFVKVFGMSRDCEGAHIHFKMAASV